MNFIKKANLPDIAIGIDLGTTNSLVAVYNNEENILLTDENGYSLTPSIVAYGTNEIIIGKDAKDEINNPDYYVISSAKRLMGKTINDIKDINLKKIIDQDSSLDIIRYKNLGITPIDVSATILKKIKEIAEIKLGQQINHAVITVPAYFDDAARNATKLAANKAGLEVLRLVNEPTAAALAYGLDSNNSGTYFIYDLGGGTFDISILKIVNGVFQVIATAGDNMLGGDDIDALIVEYLTSTYVKLNFNNQPYNRLLLLAKNLKEQLSESDEARILYDDCNLILSLEKLNELTKIIIDKTIDITISLLDEIDLSIEEIDDIILVGGSTRLLQIQDRITKLFNKSPLANINPDTVVAMGASLQAAKLCGKISNVLIDIVPLSIGVEMMGGIVEKIIERNTPLPVSVKHQFTTHKDNQTGIKFHIVQGERSLVENCRSLARFELLNIKPKKAGFAKITVIFNIDVDGILTVTAIDDESNNSYEIEIKPSYGLSKEEINHIIAQSIEKKSEDIDKKNFIEAIFKSNELITNIDQALIDLDDELDQRVIDNTRDQIAELEKLIKTNDLETINRAIYNLKAIEAEFVQKKLDHYVSNLEGKKLSEIKM